jgi:hypothetical protein
VPRRERTIDCLRRKFPGTWVYSVELHEWHQSDGFFIYPRSALASRYDGDDDTFVTQYYRSDTNEQITLRGF